MADSKITALDNLTSADPANDMIPIVDVSATPPASGNTKRISINNLLACSPSATLASATITGAANFNGGALAAYLNGSLMFGSGGNVVNFFAQSNGFAFKDNTGANNLLTISNAGVFGFLDGAGGTRMTLDSTGLGIGVSPLGKLDVGLAGSGTPRIRFTSASDNPIIETQRYSGAGSDYYGERLITGGGFYFQTAPSAAVGSQTFTTRMSLDASGRLILLASTTTPATLATNGQLTFTATSDTNLRFSYRGSDGTTRVANITLA